MYSKHLKRTLFLDRDGVINRRLVDAYVGTMDEFEFLPGVLDTIPFLNSFFDFLVVVSNQQGIGKGLMTHDDVKNIHNNMTASIVLKGGKIDAVFYCPHLKNVACRCRKPEPGLALQALFQFPEIDFRHSLMVGDSGSDIQFGERLGMHTVLVEGKNEMASSFITKTGKSIMPGFIIPTFADLPALLPHLPF